jgi:hypothetical protein
MTIYDDTRAASTPPHQQARKRRRRISAETWTTVKGNLSREWERLESIDPNSPRIKPTVGVVGWLLP